MKSFGKEWYEIFSETLITKADKEIMKGEMIVRDMTFNELERYIKEIEDKMEEVLQKAFPEPIEVPSQVSIDQIIIPAIDVSDMQGGYYLIGKPNIQIQIKKNQ